MPTCRDVAYAGRHASTHAFPPLPHLRRPSSAGSRCSRRSDLASRSPLHSVPAPQANEYKHEIGRITKELREVKKKFFEQKRREQHTLEMRRTERAQPAEQLVQEARATMNRFTGGGFNLNMTAS